MIWTYEVLKLGSLPFGGGRLTSKCERPRIPVNESKRRATAGHVKESQAPLSDQVAVSLSDAASPAAAV